MASLLFENNKLILNLSSFQIDSQEGGMTIKFDGGFLFLGHDEVKEELPSPPAVEVKKEIIVPSPPPSPSLPVVKEKPPSHRPSQSSLPAWTFSELKEEILRYGKEKGGEFIFPISPGIHGKDEKTVTARNEIFERFGGVSNTKLLHQALKELIAEKKLTRNKTGPDEPIVYQIVEAGKPLRPVLSRSEKKLIAAKEKILEYGRARGGRFEFIFRVGVRSSKESIERARALRAEHFPEFGVVVISDALDSLLTEGKLEKYQPVQSKPAIYEIKENNGGNGKAINSKDVNGRCKRCNGQLQILSTRTEGYEGEEFEYKHCVMCGQDYY